MSTNVQRYNNLTLFCVHTPTLTFSPSHHNLILMINVPQVMMEGVVWKKHGVRGGIFRRSVLGWGQVFLSCLALPVLSYLGLSYPVLPFPVLPYPVLCYPGISYPVLPFPVLSYPVVLSYPAVLENRRQPSNLRRRERIPSQIRVHPR